MWTRSAPLGVLGNYRQLQGKELSYNNIADADAAWECVRTFDSARLRHRQACQPLRRRRGGACVGSLPQGVQDRPRRRPSAASSPSTAQVDAAMAEAVSEQFLEVLLAPAYDGAALALLAKKKNVRVLEVPTGAGPQCVRRQARGRRLAGADAGCIHGGAGCAEDRDAQAAHEQQMQDMMFAWKVAKYVKSNAIVFCCGRH